MVNSSSPSFLDWGRTNYRDALALQRDLVDRRRRGEIPDTLVFTEHDPVFTIGARRGASAHVLWDAPALAARGIEVVETNRGGDVTYHGPGQLVGYPIVSLEPRRDLHAYLRLLEQALINALGCLGLAAGRNPGQTGVWLGRRKIAALGVASRAWIAWHGFALNIDNDLAPFTGIVPCGLTPAQAETTSLARELGPAHTPPLDEIKRTLAAEFWPLLAQYRNFRQTLAHPRLPRPRIARPRAPSRGLQPTVNSPHPCDASRSDA